MCSSYSQRSATLAREVGENRSNLTSTPIRECFRIVKCLRIWYGWFCADQLAQQIIGTFLTNQATDAYNLQSSTCLLHLEIERVWRIKLKEMSICIIWTILEVSQLRWTTLSVMALIQPEKLSLEYQHKLDTKDCIRQTNLAVKYMNRRKWKHPC